MNICPAVPFAFLFLFTLTGVASEPRSVVALSTDNDFFAPTQSDRDFTAGIALTYASSSNDFARNPYTGILTNIDSRLLSGVADLKGSEPTAAIEFGVYGFTPEDIRDKNIIWDDRPYSSLVYLSTSQSYWNVGRDDGWTTTLTVGALGLDVFEAGQNAIHKIIRSDRAKGWKHQISDGGEPTLRYSAAYHHYLAPSRKLKVTSFGSMGYLTEIGAALVFRDGLISSPDSRFNPELMAYGERAPGVSDGGGRENYFWGGVSIKARAYNAFLQGQFRNSEHELSASDLNVLLAEGWVGYTHTILKDVELSYVLRVQTSEVKEGKGDRTLAWGGLVVSKRFDGF